MIFQDDDLLNPNKKWGCYYVSMVNMVEKELGKVIPPEVAFRVFAQCLIAGDVDKEATVLQPDNVLRCLGSGLRLSSRSDLPAPLKATAPGEFEILKFSKTAHTHFVLGDGLGNCAEDPLPNHDMTPYKLVGKRIFSKAIK